MMNAYKLSQIGEQEYKKHQLEEISASVHEKHQSKLIKGSKIWIVKNEKLALKYYHRISNFAKEMLVQPE